jgi:hypothetical protein
MNKPERGPALEDQAPSVLGDRAIELGDDVREDVIPFNDRCVDSVCISPLGNGIASEHG